MLNREIKYPGKYDDEMKLLKQELDVKGWNTKFNLNLDKKTLSKLLD